MSKYASYSMTLLRVALGWLFLYAGVTKIIDPGWSAGGYLAGAKNFVGFFQWLTNPGILPFVNFINEWGLTLLGVSLILGALVRLSAPLGALLMLLYYLPILDGLKPNIHSFIVDEHIIYICALLLLAALHAGRTFGLDARLRDIAAFRKFS